MAVLRNTFRMGTVALLLLIISVVSAGAATVNFTVTIAGVGDGFVFVSNAVSESLVCQIGQTVGQNVTCTGLFTAGVPVIVSTLPNTPDTAFVGWSNGVCSGTDPNCIVTLNADAGVTATFTYTIYPVQTDGNVPRNYTTLQSAYDANNGSTIFARSNGNEGGSHLFLESLLLGMTRAVTIKGGYDLTFTQIPGLYSQLKGDLTVAQGVLTIENVIIN